MSHEPTDPFDKSDIIEARDATIATLRADLARVTAERDAALEKAATYEQDWYDAKSEFGTAAARMRDRIRSVEAERDAARAQVRELLPVVRAADLLAEPCDDYSLRSARHHAVTAAVRAIDPSMLEEPSDG